MTRSVVANQALDCKGLACPMPVVRTKQAMETLKPGEVIEVQATDEGSLADLQGWAKGTGHQYLGTLREEGVLKHYIRKASAEEALEEEPFSPAIGNEALRELLESAADRGKLTILDVREPAEFAFGHIPGAISIPFGELENRLGELDRSHRIYVVCRTGRRSAMACRMLQEHRFSAINVVPGMSGWADGTRSRQAAPMSPGEVARAMIARSPLFILDVRNGDAYADWKIEGPSIASANVPYFELLEGVEPALPYLPEEGTILVACAKEGSSRFVADQLAEAGRNSVRYLEGGMKAWSEHLEPVKIGDLNGGGELYQFVRPGKGCLSYMIVSEGEAAVVDAPRMTGALARFAEEKGAFIRHTIDTHLHADHISGGRKIAEEAGATYWLPAKDADEVVFSYEPLKEGRAIKVGRSEISIQPIYSPGHTIGSTSLIVDDRYLLSGDILFTVSIGRPDLAGQAEAWSGDLRRTLYETYKRLPDRLIVLPAHYGQPEELAEDGSVSAKLGDLYANNPGLNIADETAFDNAVTADLPPQPNAYKQIRQTNMGRLTPDEEEQREMEIGPNRCAIHDK